MDPEGIFLSPQPVADFAPSMSLPPPSDRRQSSQATMEPTAGAAKNTFLEAAQKVFLNSKPIASESVGNVGMALTSSDDGPILDLLRDPIELRARVGASTRNGEFRSLGPLEEALEGSHLHFACSSLPMSASNSSPMLNLTTSPFRLSTAEWRYDPCLLAPEATTTAGKFKITRDFHRTSLCRGQTFVLRNRVPANNCQSFAESKRRVRMCFRTSYLRGSEKRRPGPKAPPTLTCSGGCLRSAVPSVPR